MSQADSSVEKHSSPVATPDSCRLCGEKVQFLSAANDYDFYECTHCQLVFCPTLDQEYMNELYRTGYHNAEDGAPKKGWADVSFLRPALKLLDADDAHLMDFGCGESTIPELLRNLGYRVTGVDVAPPVRQQENRLTGDILELNLPANTYDLIYSFQVFEHLPEPLPVLNELLRLTVPGGYLLVHTDMEVPERVNQDFNQWDYVSPPDHCVFYRNNTFKVFVEDKPHELVYQDPKMIIIQKDNS